MRERTKTAQTIADSFGIAIHGGAGVIDRSRMTTERESSYHHGLSIAIDVGYAILERGGSSLDAVVEAVRLLEDDPQFNAGRGAVLTHEGEAELDASLMDGAGPRAGAVAGIRHVKNPIELARRVMDGSPHVMLIGEGAEKFAREQGLELVPNSYFHTPQREQELQRVLRREAQGDAGAPIPGTLLGTVGAVALDREGNLAAATSTGGMTDKRYGRVGDSPIIGAGTYADNATCAVSATGQGEYFMRSVAAYDVSALMKYKGMDVAGAVESVLEHLGGDGGLIALDAKGNCALSFNTPGMFRGCVTGEGKIFTAIYGNS